MPDIRQQRQQLGIIPPQIRPVWILVNVAHGIILRLICGDCKIYSPHNMRRIVALFTAKSSLRQVTTAIMALSCSIEPVPKVAISEIGLAAC
jgi:hypothetical protein